MDMQVRTDPISLPVIERRQWTFDKAYFSSFRRNIHFARLDAIGISADHGNRRWPDRHIEFGRSTVEVEVVAFEGPFLPVKSVIGVDPASIWRVRSALGVGDANSGRRAPIRVAHRNHQRRV